MDSLSCLTIEQIMKQSLRSREWTFVLAGLLTVALVIWLTLSACNSISRGFERFDAIWSTHDASTTYYIENGKTWPKEWDDLYPILTERNFDSDHIARIQVIIDFDFEFDSSGSLTEFEALSMRDRTTSGELRAANQRIRDRMIE